MERIQLHDKFFKPFIPNSRSEEAIDKVAEKLNNDYCDKDEPIFLSVLNGSFMFTAALMGRLKFNCEISFVKLASYTGTESTGCISKLIGLSDRVKGRKVVIIEDIVDSGNTIEELVRLLNEIGVAEIKICTLFLKPKAYKKDIPIDYPAMEIGNEFIVGFGLDYDQLGRQYKDIYIID